MFVCESKQEISYNAKQRNLPLYMTTVETKLQSVPQQDSFRRTKTKVWWDPSKTSPKLEHGYDNQ